MQLWWAPENKEIPERQTWFHSYQITTYIVSCSTIWNKPRSERISACVCVYVHMCAYICHSKKGKKTEAHKRHDGTKSQNSTKHGIPNLDNILEEGLAITLGVFWNGPIVRKSYKSGKDLTQLSSYLYRCHTPFDLWGSPGCIQDHNITPTRWTLPNS